MFMSVLNKNILGQLHKLGLNVKQFRDKTFDGIFDNVPPDIGNFFDWFMENITSDNVLTELEQAEYFELEKNLQLPTEEEVNYKFSSFNVSYQELQLVDINYISNFLNGSLEDTKKIGQEYNNICSRLQTEHKEIKKKWTDSKVNCNILKKQFNLVKSKSSDVSLLYRNKLDEVKTFLFGESHTEVSFDYYMKLLMLEKNIYSKYNMSLKNEIFNTSDLTLLPELKNNLAYVEVALVVYPGIVKVTKAKIDVLLELIKKKQKKFNDSVSSNTSILTIINTEGIMKNEEEEDLKNLESKIFEKMKNLAKYEIQYILDQYFWKNVELNETEISTLQKFGYYLKLDKSIKMWILHILIRSISFLEMLIDTRKEVCAKLEEEEKCCSFTIGNFEMKKQRYKESLSRMNFSALKNICNYDDSNLESNEASLANLSELLSKANDECCFISHKIKTDFRASIKSIFDNALCGPTREISFVPIDLTIKFQNCKQLVKETSHQMKRLANKYLETKENVARSDRKKLLLWMDILNNPTDYKEKIKNLRELLQHDGKK